MNDSEPEIQICHSEDDDDQFIPRNQKNLTLQKDILCNLDLKMCSSTPFLAVSTFERLFDNFSIDTEKLMKLIENVGESVPNFTETSRDSMCGLI